MRIILGSLIVLLLTTMLGASSSCAGSARAVPDPLLQRFEYRQVAMGTTAFIALYAPDKASADAAVSAAFERIEEVEQRLSSWREDSEVHRLEAQAGEESVAVSADLGRVLDTALDVAKRSGGAFNPTAGALFDVWRTARAEGVLPDEDAIGRALATADVSRVEVGADGIRLAKDTRLDLGGVGKGYGCDAALGVLESAGLPRAMVEIGGDVACGAPPPGEKGWRVQIGSGREGDARSVYELQHGAFATSGPTYQSLEVAGEQYSHIVDPRDGRALTHDDTISVLAESAALADALATAASVLSAPESRALIASYPGARLFLNAVEVEDENFAGIEREWVELFDGESLQGWTPRGGRYDGNARWNVEDGVIVGRPSTAGEGGLLYTERSYSSFEFRADVALDYPFDSGIFVRMLPPDSGLKGMQVTLDYRDGGEIGGLYSDGWIVHQPDGVKAFKRDEWNAVRVRCTGFDMHIEAWINDVQVADHRLDSDASMFATRGLIGLQVHPVDASQSEQRARFRNVRVRELPMFANAELTAEAGWRDMLGKGLDGFVESGTKGGYRIEDGVLSIPVDGSGTLNSVDDYRNFRLRMDFRLAEMANSGVYLRSMRDGSNPSYSGAEIQLLDDFNWEARTNSELVPYQFTGGLYGALPPGPDKEFAELGSWNRLEVLVRGTRYAAALNERVLWDVDVGTLDVKPAFAERASEGFIGLQRYGAPDVVGDWSVQVRRMLVAPIEAATED